MDKHDFIVQDDWGTKQRKVAIVISEAADAVDLEIHIMVKPDIWVYGSKLPAAELEENRTLLFIARRMLADVAAKIKD